MGRARSFFRALSNRPVIVCWVGWALLLLLARLHEIVTFSATDPDDYMRIMQVRDLLAGQSWFDVHQYHLNPPFGADMHWSRLVDIPLAICLVVARLFLAEPAASTVAMAAVPLLQLLVAMILMDRLMRALGASDTAARIAVLVIPLFPLLFTSFAPMRVDHHGWQTIGALGCGLMLARMPDRRSAIAGGAIAAAWLSVSLEGLPLVALLAAVYGLAYIFRRETSVAWFMAGLAAIGPLLFIATRPLGQLADIYCDVLSWPHMAGFAAAAVGIAAIARLPRESSPLIRAACLGAVGALVAAVIVLPIGICAISPFANLDPVLQANWYRKIMEGLPITQQILSTQFMLVWCPLAILIVWRIVLARDAEAKERWVYFTLYALAASAMSMLVMRGGINAQILTLPFAAILIERLLPKARGLNQMLVRVVATVGVFVIATPTLATAVVTHIDRAFPAPDAGPSAEAGSCQLQRLAQLPQGHIFATMDISPEIIARTEHTAVMSGYHRNARKMLEVMAAFGSDMRQAQALVEANRADYLAVCLDRYEIFVMARRTPDNLAKRLMDGQPPDWLRPISGFDNGSLRVYRVVRP